ncbi:MAG: response regulator [Bacteroidia bacterium]
MNKSDFVEILIVEDNVNDAKLAQLALSQEKLANNLIWLKDGAQALDFLFGEGEYAGREVSNTPKLILLDLKMPKVGGIEVLKKIRGDERTRHIPVAVMTSSSEEKDIIEAYNLWVNSYIVKPVDFDKFAKCVKEVGLYWLVVNHPPINDKR